MVGHGKGEIEDAVAAGITDITGNSAGNCSRHEVVGQVDAIGDGEDWDIRENQTWQGIGILKSKIPPATKHRHIKIAVVVRRGECVRPIDFIGISYSMKIGQRSACVFHDLSAKARSGDQAGYIEAERLPVVDEELRRWPDEVVRGRVGCVLNVDGPLAGIQRERIQAVAVTKDGGVILPKVGIGEEAHAGNGSAEIVRSEEHTSELQ